MAVTAKKGSSLAWLVAPLALVVGVWVPVIAASSSAGAAPPAATAHATTASPLTSLPSTGLSPDAECFNTSFCVAVDASGTVFIDSNGVWNWSAKLFSSSTNHAIACASESDCVAAGGAEAYSFNGSNWSGPVSLGTPNNPSGTYTASCTPAGVCVVIDCSGYSRIYSDGQWSPVDYYYSGSNMFGISCPSATFCAGVGRTVTTTKVTEQATNFQFLDDQWTVTLTPSAPIDTIMDSIACATEAFCVSVGMKASTGVFRGTDWNLVSTPTIVFWSHELSCPQVNFCVGGFLGDLSIFNGSRWSQWGSLNSAGTYSWIGGLTCASVDRCYMARATGKIVTFNPSEPAPAPTPTSSPPPNQSTPTSGYDLVGSDGGVFVFPTGQSSGFYGSLPGLGVTPTKPIVGMVPTTTDQGYFLVGSDGGVFVFGNAPFLGSLPGDGVTPTQPIVGIVAANTDKGYFLVGKDGGVFAFGTVPYLGSLPGDGVSVDNIIGIAATPSGNGYWLVGATGTVYAFGAAQQLGSATGSSSPVSAIAGTPTGGGYWITTQNGSVYAYGNAGFYGSLPGDHVTPAEPVIGIVHTTTSQGYWLLGADGGIFAYGNAPFDGSLPGLGVSVTNIVGAVPTSG